MNTTRRDLFRPLIGNLGMPKRDPGSHGGSILGGLGGSPALFSAQIDIAAGTKGVSLDQKTLQPGFRNAYLIDEIRISAYSAASAGAADNTVAQQRTGILGVISAKFQTGVHAFSQSAIPIGLYAPRWSRLDYGGQIVGEPTAGNFAYASYGHVRWPLPVPLYMAPGDALQCTLDRDTTRLAALGTITVQVAYAGRMVVQGAPAPVARAVPWVGWFEKLSTEGQVQSQDKWRNPFMIPLHVQRLTMRSYRAVDSSDYFYGNDYFGLMAGSSNSGTNSYERLALEDSLGYKMVAGSSPAGGAAIPPPVGSVFDMARCAWTFGRPLGAREAFQATVTNLTPSSNAAYKVATQFGMVGYREEQS